MKVTLKKIVFMLMIVIISMVAGCGREKSMDRTENDVDDGRRNITHNNVSYSRY